MQSVGRIRVQREGPSQGRGERCRKSMGERDGELREGWCRSIGAGIVRRMIGLRVRSTRGCWRGRRVFGRTRREGSPGKESCAEKWARTGGPWPRYEWVFLYWVWVTWRLGGRYVTGQKPGRGPGPGVGRVRIRDAARDRVRRKAGAAIRDWSKPRWGRALDEVNTSPTGPERSPGVNTYIPSSHKGKGWSGHDESKPAVSIALLHPEVGFHRNA